ncbi:hypothetical protein KM043_011833 [Ampulex compressa]|nr:hypothetical protein KM043_011833 [Ampulex compressa]
MLKHLAVLAIAGFYLATAEYFDKTIADKDFLIKQKKVFNLLYHVSQPSLVNLPLYNEGKEYNIEANIDSYSNSAVVKDFLYLYEHGMLPRGEVFSVYYPKLLKESEALFRLFYYAKDFDTFYKTAAWARIYVNEGSYVYALYNAVIRRPDTIYIQLPAPYEMYPYAFFNSEVLEKAHHAKLFGKKDSKKFGAYDTYIIPANYSGWYLTRDYELDHKLNYFTEDIGFNAYYFYFRQEFPFWLKSAEFGLPQYRGEEYLYGHKQIMSRYFLERLANDLGKIEDFDWEREFYSGYYPTMTYHNGLPFPQRPYWSRFPYYKYKYIKDINDMESRVSAAIDSGFIVDADRKFVNIYTEEGLNILGNLIEGNVDSCNIEFYGSIDRFARKILGFNLEPSSSHQVVPSALENFSTSLRDPAFYRLYKRIFYYYYRYKMHQKPYVKDEVVFPELKFESLTTDKLSTYFDQFDATISNGLMVESENEAENMLIKVRQYRLNHKPFSLYMTIHADKPIKAAIRIFLGPKYDVHHRPLEFPEDLKYFYEMDNYIVDLTAGQNKIVRNSQDFFFVMPDQEPSEVFYKSILKAMEGSENLVYQQRLQGFPERLLLPKGKKEGFPVQLFVYVSPVTTEPLSYTSRIWGNYQYDNKPFGFPLDRYVQNFRYDGPNMIFKDVMIYHKDDVDLNVTY